MIEISGIYKLKKIRNSELLDDKSDYKVVAMDKEYVICENLETSERFFFLKDFLIDPEKPNDIYSNITELNKKLSTSID